VQFTGTVVACPTVPVLVRAGGKYKRNVWSALCHRYIAAAGIFLPLEEIPAVGFGVRAALGIPSEIVRSIIWIVEGTAGIPLWSQREIAASQNMGTERERRRSSEMRRRIMPLSFVQPLVITHVQISWAVLARAGGRGNLIMTRPTT
jgi:hypothetical protein